MFSLFPRSIFDDDRNCFLGGSCANQARCTPRRTRTQCRHHVIHQEPVTRRSRFQANVKMLPDRHGGAHLLIHLPNFDKTNINLLIEDQCLRIQAQRATSHVRKSFDGYNIHLQEVKEHSIYDQTFRLASTIDIDGISARFEGGVLSIQLPAKAKHERKTLRRIRILGEEDVKEDNNGVEDKVAIDRSKVAAETEREEPSKAEAGTESPTAPVDNQQKTEVKVKHSMLEELKKNKNIGNVEEPLLVEVDPTQASKEATGKQQEEDEDWEAINAHRHNADEEEIDGSIEDCEY